MQNRAIGSLILLASAVLVFSSVALAQGGQRGAAPAAAAPAPPHDPRDLSGIWLSEGGGRGGTLTQWSPTAAPLTPEGQAAWNANKPPKGPRAIVPALANDPLGDANPPGLLRTFLYSRPFEFIHLDGRVMQVFEWTNKWRQVFTDGREVPVPEDTGPFWYGYSVGRWEGDTFVVQTVGLDPRQWLDEWGTPYSDALRLTERWRRVDRDNMELTITVDDPKTFTRTWTSEKRTFARQPKDSPNGELLEVIFAPMDEKLFNEVIRDPAGGVVNQ
jgi:hypothetical protein